MESRRKTSLKRSRQDFLTCQPFLQIPPTPNSSTMLGVGEKTLKSSQTISATPTHTKNNKIFIQTPAKVYYDDPRTSQPVDILLPPVEKISYKIPHSTDNLVTQKTCGSNPIVDIQEKMIVEEEEGKSITIPCLLKILPDGSVQIIMSPNGRRSSVNQRRDPNEEEQGLTCGKKEIVEGKSGVGTKWKYLCTREEFQCLEKCLMDSKTARENLVTEMRSNGGRTARQFCTKNLSLLMTHTLAKQFDWTDRSGMESFKRSRVSSIILDLAMELFSSTTRNQLEGFFKIWFEQTHRRFKPCTRNSRPKVTTI